MAQADVVAGARIYTGFVLGCYDAFVIRFSNSVVWRCHRSRMLDLYRTLVAEKHLEVGPGTGWFLARTALTSAHRVTLLDLNPESLVHSARRLAHVRPSLVNADILQPLDGVERGFRSIGINYVLHCLPGNWERKEAALAHAAAQLDPHGVLFGSTILGDGVRHNVLGRMLMRLYNRKGIFHNRRDDRDGLAAALERVFEDVQVDVVGAVAIFVARRPRAQRN